MRLDALTFRGAGRSFALMIPIGIKSRMELDLKIDGHRPSRMT
jgi:hypothetical protein